MIYFGPLTFSDTQVAPAPQWPWPPAPQLAGGELAALRCRVDALELRLAAMAATAPPPDPAARCITVEQAAHRLGCGKTRVFDFLRDGMLSRGKKAGRATMVTVASVERLEGVRRG